MLVTSQPYAHQLVFLCAGSVRAVIKCQSKSIYRAWILTGIRDTFLIFGNLLVCWRQPADITPNKRTSHDPLSLVSDTAINTKIIWVHLLLLSKHRDVCLMCVQIHRNLIEWQLLKALAEEHGKSHPDRHCSLSRGVPTFSSAGRKEIVPS